MVHVMAEDFKTNEPWPELEKVEERIISRVIPRLIGALEADGRSVKPCLIHADLVIKSTYLFPLKRTKKSPSNSALVGRQYRIFIRDGRYHLVRRRILLCPQRNGNRRLAVSVQ